MQTSAGTRSQPNASIRKIITLLTEPVWPFSYSPSPSLPPFPLPPHTAWDVTPHCKYAHVSMRYYQYSTAIGSELTRGLSVSVLYQSQIRFIKQLSGGNEMEMCGLFIFYFFCKFWVKVCQKKTYFHVKPVALVYCDLLLTVFTLEYNQCI